jgi:hypothetical protein
MPELETRYGYFVVLGVIAAIMVSLYLGFKRNKWLWWRDEHGDAGGWEPRSTGAMGPPSRPKGERAHHAGWTQTRPTRLPRLRPVSVEAIITSTAATAIAISQRTQSMPGLPSPPNAV